MGAGRLAGRRQDAGTQVQRVGRLGVGGGLGAELAVQRTRGQRAPEQGGADAQGLEFALPLAHGGGDARGVEVETALALQFTTAQARFQAGDGPALAELLDVGLQALQWQALLIGGADECVVEDELRAPAVAFGPGLQPAAQGRGGRGGPERGEVQGLGVQVGAHQRLVGPGQDAGGERERGFRAGGAESALGPGAEVQRGLCAGERAACPGFGGQAQAGTVGHGGADVALQVQRQRHRGFATQAELCAVVAVGELQRVQAQAVGGAQAGGVGQRGGVPAVAQGAVTVVPSDAVELERCLAREFKVVHTERQAQRQGQRERLHRFAGRGRALVVHPQRADGQRLRVGAAAEQGAGPQRFVPVQLHALGLHAELTPRPAQRGDTPAAAQAAFDAFGVQLAQGFGAPLHPAVGPAQRLRQRARCGGPEPERHAAGEQQGERRAGQPGRHPAQAPPTRARAVLGRRGFGRWGRAVVFGHADQKLKPTLRWTRNRLASTP